MKREEKILDRTPNELSRWAIINCRRLCTPTCQLTARSGNSIPQAEVSGHSWQRIGFVSKITHELPHQKSIFSLPTCSVRATFINCPPCANSIVSRCFNEAYGPTLN